MAVAERNYIIVSVRVVIDIVDFILMAYYIFVKNVKSFVRFEMVSEVLLIMLLAFHATQIAQLADLNCGFLDQDNGVYLVNNYYHYRQNATAYFERTSAIANCEVTKERYVFLRDN